MGKDLSGRALAQPTTDRYIQGFGVTSVDMQRTEKLVENFFDKMGTRTKERN